MPAFKELLAHAQKKLKTDVQLADYWKAYLKGLEHGHYGDRFGVDEET